MPRRPGNDNSWRKKRRQGYLEKRERFYIFCEGAKTEPNYFNGFKRLIENNPIYRNMITVHIESCATDTVRVLDTAESYINRKNIVGAGVWCVYDKDNFSAADFDGAANRINKLNKCGKGIKYYAAWSNECIEFWFVLHFADYRSNNSRSYYTAFLNEQFRKLGLGRYTKNMENIFEILMTKGNFKQAVCRAKRIIGEAGHKAPSEIAPGTKVYELAERLAQYLDI